MRKFIIFIMTLLIMAVLFSGIIYQCIVTKEHPLLGIYILLCVTFLQCKTLELTHNWLVKVFKND